MQQPRFHWHGWRLPRRVPRSIWPIGLVLLAPACARFGFELFGVTEPERPGFDAGPMAPARPPPPEPAPENPRDASLPPFERPVDASLPPASADASLPLPCAFGTPEPLVGLGLSGAVWRPALASDGTTLFLARSLGNEQQIFTAARTGGGAQFGLAVELVEVNGPTLDGTPFISADLLTLYLFSTRPGGPGDRDLWVATRALPEGPFQTPEPLPVVNAPGIDQVPALTPDERTLIWESVRAGGAGDADLWMSVRPSRELAFTSPVNIAELNTPAQEGGPSLSSNGLTLFFITNRDAGPPDIWAADRADASSPFAAARPVSEVNSAADEHDPFISPDDQELFFSSNRGGSQQLWVARRSCP